MAKNEKSYEEMTIKELRKIAKVYNISGRWDMTKESMIEAIRAAEAPTAQPEEPEATEIEEDLEDDELNEVDEDSAEETVEPESEEEIEAERQRRYAEKARLIESAPLGTIVAFHIVVYGIDKVKSAMLVNRNSKAQKVKLQNKHGAEFIVGYDEIVWVRLGSNRWPDGIFELLKGKRQYEKDRGING